MTQQDPFQILRLFNFTCNTCLNKNNFNIPLQKMPAETQKE